MANSLDQTLSQIAIVSADLCAFPDQVYAPLGSVLADIEWYSLAAVKKTASQSHAFQMLVRERNTLSATAIIRLQLDTAMRVFGLSLIKDLEAAGTRLMHGENYRRLKSWDGEKLTDAYLHAELNKHHPGVTEAYESTSAYVHLSGEHIKSGLLVGPGTLGNFFHLQGQDQGRADKDYEVLAETFLWASTLTSNLLKAFINTRPGPEIRASEVAKRRAAK